MKIQIKILEHPYYLCVEHQISTQTKESSCCPRDALQINNNTQNNAPDFECPHCGEEYLEFEEIDFTSRNYIGDVIECQECRKKSKITAVDFEVHVWTEAIYDEASKS